jgi:hypothetical protein
LSDRASRPPNAQLGDARRRLLSPSGSGRALSRQELADAVNAYLWVTYRERGSVDRGYVGKLEQGVHRWPRARVREAFRHVLNAATNADLGFFIIRNDTSVLGTAAQSRVSGEDDVNRRELLADMRAPALGTLIAAMVGPFADTGKMRNKSVDSHLDALAAQLIQARSAYQHSQYTSAAQGVADLLLALQYERESSADGHRIAVLSAEAYQVASALLLKADDPVLAAIAAERSVAAAQVADEDLTVASSARAVVHCLTASGHPQLGAALATGAAERLAGEADMDAPAVLSLYGALLLRGALAAARRDDRSRAQTLLDEAARAARHLGRDDNLYWTAFGPTNVAVHRVAVAVELGDAGSAVTFARSVDLAKLQLPERRAMLLLDTARALTQWGKWERAFEAIRSAERQAPEEVRARPATHTMINQLAQRCSGPLQRRVHAYARQVGASA